MSELPQLTNDPIPSSSDKNISDVKNENEGPEPKKRKIDVDKEVSDKLEHRLGGILCCAVCLELPPAAIYQCINGHLMCAPCFMHLLADARLRDESATCPNCRVEISKASASRNLAVEKTVSELPSECKYCTKVFPRHSLQNHEERTCEESSEYKFSQTVVTQEWGVLNSVACVLVQAVPDCRRVFVQSSKLFNSVSKLTGCRFACIGCSWRGPAHEAAAHQADCTHPRKSAAEVVDIIAEREKRAKEANAVYGQILDLFSYEKLTFTDLQLKPYRTEEFVHKLYYESSRFSAFGHQWVVKAFVNKNEQDPTQSSQREITYQLILKSKSACSVGVQWVWLRGPYGELAVRARAAAHAFSDDAAASPPLPLPLRHTNDANRFLSNKAINFRLIMFLTSK